MEPVAIIGLSCRYPGSLESPKEFWDLISSGVVVNQEPPKYRFSEDTVETNETGKKSKEKNAKSPPPSHATKPPPTGAYLEGLQLFDAEFFKISAEEVVNMDPHQRVMLSVGYEALCSAGLDKETVRMTKTGVFIGVEGPGVGWKELIKEVPSSYLERGSALSMIANRISQVRRGNPLVIRSYPPYRYSSYNCSRQ